MQPPSCLMPRWPTLHHQAKADPNVLPVLGSLRLQIYQLCQRFCSGCHFVYLMDFCKAYKWLIHRQDLRYHHDCCQCDNVLFRDVDMICARYVTWCVLETWYTLDTSHTTIDWLRNLRQAEFFWRYGVFFISLKAMSLVRIWASFQRDACWHDSQIVQASTRHPPETNKWSMHETCPLKKF